MAKNENQNVRFKRKETSFSIIANPIIDDKNISPAAGWLYVTIQRWITFNVEGFVCSKSFIASKYQSGYRMFNRAWDELKKAGYLKMYSHPTEGWSAELLDEPLPDAPHTFYLDLNGNVKSTNIERALKKEKNKNNHYPQNDGNGDHYSQNDSNAFDSNGFDSNGNGGNIINTSVKTFNKDSDNESINPSKEQNKKEKGRVIDDTVINDIRDQIEYDNLEKEFDSYLLDTVISCIADLYGVSESQKFNQRTYSVEFIRNRSLAITKEHVEYVLNCFQDVRETVKNIRKYLTTAIFNAPDTFGAHRENVTRAAGFLD